MNRLRLILAALLAISCVLVSYWVIQDLYHKRQRQKALETFSENVVEDLRERTARLKAQNDELERQLREE